MNAKIFKFGFIRFIAIALALITVVFVPALGCTRERFLAISSETAPDRFLFFAGSYIWLLSSKYQKLKLRKAQERYQIFTW